MKKIGVVLIIALVVMQFIRPDRTYVAVDTQTDFLSVTQAPENIAAIVKKNCYDCHSDQTAYPWYTNVAPLSFWINHHIEEGKEHLNFSNWTKYPAKKAAHKLEEFFEEVEEGKMPLESYTYLHGSLSETDKSTLLTWVQSIR